MRIYIDIQCIYTYDMINVIARAKHNASRAAVVSRSLFDTFPLPQLPLSRSSVINFEINCSREAIAGDPRDPQSKQQ